MKSTPEILRHKGILTNWRDYPEGSVERAKALGIDVWQVSDRVETTLERWEAEVRVLQREKPWKVLGIKDANEFVKAIIGKSVIEIAKQIKRRVQIREIKEKHPDWTQQHIADEVGCSQQYVAKVTTEKYESYDLVVPEHVKSKNDKADFRKLPVELQQKVAAKEVSLNAAAIKAGIRKKPTAEEQCVKAFRKCDSRLVPLKVIVESLESHEMAVVMDWIKERVDGRRLD